VPVLQEQQTGRLLFSDSLLAKMLLLSDLLRLYCNPHRPHIGARSLSSTTNRLDTATSPYLLQHADNPVHWQPWDNQALSLARELDVPILLSIGYAACHWCHVMAHESFADETTATLMNELYVCIKVDREERPDLDKTYQMVHQILTRRAGGWPLTLALDPTTLTPFFAGTYFPPDARYGMPGFQDVLRQVAAHYRKHKAQLSKHHEAICQTLTQIEQRPQESLPDDISRACLEQLQDEFDDDFGGFGGAPKFPQPARLDFCLQYATANMANQTEQQNRLANTMAQQTLLTIADSGLFDHLAGGFFRYSNDDKWQIPHFEKMLYDNAQLLRLFAEVWILDQNSRYHQVAAQTIDWILDEMQDPQGGYFSSLDADAEGIEGQYYIWSKEQISHCLPDTCQQALILHYGLDQDANFEGRWHLQIKQSIEQVANTLQQTTTETAQQLQHARSVLLQQRQQRIRPGLDDKILCAWNAMTCAAMARAGWYLGQQNAIDSAIDALHFIRQSLWKDGRLLAVYRGGISHGEAFLDDYAHMLDAILSIIQVHWEEGLLEWACDLANVVLEHFATGEGDFYFTADDDENVLHRHRPASDDAIPSGNGIMARILGQLGSLMVEPRYLKAQQQLLEATSGVVLRAPAHHCSLVSASLSLQQPWQTVILRGPRSGMNPWLQQLASACLPTLQLCLLPNEATIIPSALADKPVSEKVVAYHCRLGHCLPPISNFEELLLTLHDSEQ